VYVTIVNTSLKLVQNLKVGVSDSNLSVQFIDLVLPLFRAMLVGLGLTR